MAIVTPLSRPNLPTGSKTQQMFLKFERLIQELNKKNIPDSVAQSINTYVQAMNNIPDGDKNLQKQVVRYHRKTLQMVAKELKLVSKNYYRNLWMSLGIAAFGIPLGMGIGVALGDIGLFGIGLPLGVALGIIVGVSMDNKAKKEGKQLNV
ncbi:hypothetical protein [Paucihalobacter sp.]|uniref:hypothetical protein n=1 Tax=Paucihalobacter sp. TaxID=2850405 RepID=UPI003D16179F